MQIPHKLRIKRGVAYEICYVDDFDDPDKLAECRKDPPQILIRSGLSNTETMKAFIHEALHAIEFESGIPIPHKIIYALEAGIYRVLVLNGFLK